LIGDVAEEITMKCWEFKEMLTNLAGDRLTDHSIGESALAHTAVCAPCAQRLAAQRALTAGLLEFSEETRHERASPQVKERLRAALAERRSTQTSRANVASMITPATARRPRWPVWTLAAAAILTLCTMTVVWWKNSTQPVREDLTGGAPSVPADTRSSEVANLGPAPPPAQGDQATRPRPPQTAAPRSGRLGRSNTNDRVADETEIASEFVPLTLTADEKALENGTLVRLTVPRARLVAMGLPLQGEADRETINAEVIMGDNGVAYAIRVVP
jgi:hypothetical protein